MANSWREYQEAAAEFFRSLGMSAETNVTLQGVRTSHHIDVVARGEYAGFSILWIVECKYWGTRVTKLHVLALREIVSDLGADRGILLAESGFQSGACEAAHLTNIQVTSLEELRAPAESQIYAQRAMELYDRVQGCRERYWNLSKKVRIKYGLRPDVGALGYSGDHIIALADDLLKKSMRGVFPVKPDEFHRMLYRIPEAFPAVRQIYEGLLPLVDDLERKLKRAEDAAPFQEGM